MGFLAEALGMGGQNKFEAKQADIPNTDYATQLKKMMDAGILNPVNFDQSNQARTNQQQLSDLLMQTIQGNGPSVAQNQLNNTTNQNIAQGAGMIGSQKGLNPALALRMILNNTANTNQNAAGQGALLRAQEILGSQNIAGNVLNQQRGQDISQSLGQVQSGLSQLGTVGNLQNAQSGNMVNNTNSANTLNRQTAAENATAAAKAAKDVTSAVGDMLIGGPAKNMFGGGGQAMGEGGGESGGGGGGGMGSWAGGGGGGMGAIALASEGGMVPGKAGTMGDSPKNDKVPAMLSPGEIVVPRTAAKDPEKAKEFIEALMKHKVSQGQEEPTFGHVIAAQRGLHDRLSMLEKMCYGGVS